jgi:hypothetical protein
MTAPTVYEFEEQDRAVLLVNAAAIISKAVEAGCTYTARFRKDGEWFGVAITVHPSVTEAA